MNGCDFCFDSKRCSQCEGMGEIEEEDYAQCPNCCGSGKCPECEGVEV